MAEDKKVSLNLLLDLLKKLGADTKVSKEEIEPYLPQEDSNFYVPKIDYKSLDLKGLRDLTLPNSEVLRRLHGIRKRKQ